ncbi:serine/threonine-protein kinase-like protein At1g28390 [Gastrolobium bilobum]|uniref:serine/threonine-protein kinase-like protein At1g28390 n=1 Tax=Gastrolobium bilobum TaxID=150636 RepID=UPI002AAF9CA7|nr:serine/threonine-protein kinase-like protein At1g28390 [Gastrolobium bilobum]
MGYFSCNGESAIATCDPHYKHLKNKTKTNTNSKSKTHNIRVREFSYSELFAATNGFSADTFLGKGSHGSVYRATLDGGNLIAAVKRNKPSAITHHNINPADNEIEILSRVASPRRLVNLIGFCTHQNDNLIVVEYMPNGSLYELLHRKAVRPPGWTRRVRFALQVAKAVHELHSADPPVIHRDIKSSNVLIDGRWNARLGDFGLALRGNVEDVRFTCTPPAGTLGYLDPCYLAPADLSTKRDVFSFGILLLEITSGRNAIDVNHSPPSVLDWAVPLIRRGEFAGICDPRIGPPSDKAAIRQLTVLAARCVRSTVEKRPSMAEVAECLKEVRKRVHAPLIWSSLKKRVKARGGPLVNDYDRSEEVVKGGSRRNGKVSSVSGVEYESEPANRAVRSRSIGSGFFSEIKMKSGSDPNMGGHPSKIEYGFGSKKGKMVVTTRFNRSRSMGFLQSPRRLRYGSENVIGKSKISHQNHNNNYDPIRSGKMALSELVIMDKKLEQRMIEKPLVYSHRVENQSN